MSVTRREFIQCAAGLGGALWLGLGKRGPSRAEEALRPAVRFLAARQSPDGAWRSEHYAAFRDGDALTPLVLWALPSEGAVFARGLAWLERLTAARSELSYPLFTASYAAQVFTFVGDPQRAAVWGEVVASLQTSTALGWPAEACGAWSDSSTPPRYSDPVSDMIAPNISATVLGVQALVAAGRADRAQAALPFLERCQNFAADHATGFDDGGFFFATDDPIRNKAGVAGRDVQGRTRLRSYGSATCDGLLALRGCGLAEDHPRVRAALAWIKRNARGLKHSGAWPAARVAARDSLVFYHAQALADVLGRSRGGETLRRGLVDDLLTQQSSDGSWRGISPASCEDDPLVATTFALRVLAAGA